MAATALPRPGTEYGPCAEPCAHRDCAASRRMADEVCRFCGEAIGYETYFYDDPQKPEGDSLVRGLVHAPCLERSLE